MLLLDDYGPTGETGGPNKCIGEVRNDGKRNPDDEGGM